MAALTSAQKRRLNRQNHQWRKLDVAGRIQFLNTDGTFTGGTTGAGVRVTGGAGGITADFFVYISGYDTTEEQFVVLPADAATSAKAVDIFWCPAAIAAAAVDGYAYKQGAITGVNTNAGNVGDPVYLADASAGGWTLTEPTGTDRVRQVGSIAVKSSSIGVISVDLGGEAITVHDHADNAGGGTIAVTSTSNISFEVYSGTAEPSIAISGSSGGTGDFTQTIQAAATVTVGDATILLPDTASAGDTIVCTTIAQTLAAKTFTTPTISATGFTNAQHAHSGATSGGLVSGSSALTGTTATAFEIDTDGTVPAIALGVGTTGDFTQLLKPAATLTVGDAVITIPDTASVAGVVVLEDTTQTLTLKTLTTPTIGDLTNMTHDHSSNAEGGTLASIAGLTGTTSTTFDVDSGGDHVRIDSAGQTADHAFTFPDNDDELVGIAATQTLASKTLSNPTYTGGAMTFGANVTVSGTWDDIGIITTMDCNGGTLDGVTIGGSAAGAISATTIASSGAATLASLVCTAGATFGGGYGATGATISTAGVGQFDDDLTTDAVLTGDTLVVTAGATFGGGYGAAGTTITTAGVITSNGAASFDGNVTVGVDASAATVIIYPSTTNRGTFILSAGNGATDHNTTLASGAVNGGDATITLPILTSTLPGLGLDNAFTGTNTFSGTNTFTAPPAIDYDQATSNDVQTTLTIKRTVSGGNGATGIGQLHSFWLENDAGAEEEYASFQVVTTDAGNGTEDADLVWSTMTAGAVAEVLRVVAASSATVADKLVWTANTTEDDAIVEIVRLKGNVGTGASGFGAGISVWLTNDNSDKEEHSSIQFETDAAVGAEDTDIIFNTMLDGTVTEALRLDASDNSLTLGADTSKVTKLRIHPATTNKGTFILAAADNTGDTDFTLTNIAQGGANTAQVPDLGAGATDQFVMEDVTQTLTAKTLTSPVIGTRLDLNAAAGAANSSSRIVVRKNAIADGVATAVITFTIPNAAHGAICKVTILGMVDDQESVRGAEGLVILSRVAAANVVGAVAALDLAQIATGGAETLTLAYSLSAAVGAAGASNTMDLQLTLDTSGGSDGEAIIVAELINGEATGITMAAA